MSGADVFPTSRYPARSLLHISHTHTEKKLQHKQQRKHQVFKNWLCSAVSAKLRACVPKFFSLSYRVFNLGICIPTLELDSRFLER